MITRENYEEFFLSYVDNELPAETRLAVEHFARANPDLGEELETLLQCRLEPESDAEFPGKHSLLQYEESLLLYVDGELDEAGRKSVEELTQREPHYARELKRLRDTVSDPDAAILFPDKESLYHPAKRRRVVVMPWLQATAAAAVIGAVVVLLLPHGHKTDNPATAVAKNNSRTVTPPVTSPLYSGRNASTATLPDKPTLQAPAVAEKAVHRTNALTPADGARTATPHARNATHETIQPATAPTDLASTNPTTYPDRTTGVTGTIASNATATSNATAVSNSTAASSLVRATDPTTARKEKAAATSVAAVDIPKDQRSFATQELQNEAREEGDGDVADNTPPTTGKTKLRGLFRRVTRTFGKTADRDDDGSRQVSISVFQVALK
jgi:anti-sigma factor RsiW